MGEQREMERIKEVKAMNLIELLHFCGQKGIEFHLQSIGSDLYGILKRAGARNDFVVQEVYKSEVCMQEFEEELLSKFKRELESMERGNKYGL